MTVKGIVYREMAAQIDAALKSLSSDGHGGGCSCMSCKAAADTKPTFKPNPKLGEGYPTPEELVYRGKLLDELKVLNTDINSFIDEDLPVNVKVVTLKNSVNSYISRAKKVARDELLKAYDTGVEDSIKDLADIGVAVDIEGVDDTGIKKLIQYQEVAIEESGMVIFYRYKNFIYRMAAW